ncbi:MAG: dihydroorotase [Eubacterium sp.]|nr:dihydroorotase [Eubacterium sp.]
MTLIIKNGRVLDPAVKQDVFADVLIRDGKIEKVMPDIQEAADRQIDAAGCFVMPGFIDLHVHLRDPGFEQKETVATGAAAAARGGFTTIVAMPNTKPVVDHADVVNYVHNKAKSVTKVNVLQAGAITKKMEGMQLADIEQMVQAGSPAISEDGKSVMNAYVLQEAMKIAKRLDIPVLSHCEDKNLVNGGVVNADENAKKRELPGITNSVENVIIIRDVQLARETGAKLHLCHCSTKESVEIVRMAKERGNTRITAEVCPHHFTLSSDEMVPGDTNYKMNPPLRTREDVEALRQGLKEDVMDVIATDHAPHTRDEKNDSMLRAPFGIIGLETAAALAYTELVLSGYLTPMQMAEKMSYNPARVLGIDKGSLQPGKAADLVIFDPEKTYRIDASEFASKSRNTPFQGREVTGAVRVTIAGGEVIYQAE